jgi:hypothetical protein
MSSTLKDNEWERLIYRIKSGKCTPFIGAGACYGFLPLGKDLAKKWSKKYKYPFKDYDDLARVAQFLAVEHDPVYPKEILLREFANYDPPDFRLPEEPHTFLAKLPLSLYLTTNYDSFMVKALEIEYKDPKRELCRWNPYLKNQKSIFDSLPDFKPTPANPVVYHLHGHDKVTESLILTEDDYLQFLANMAFEPEIIPVRIQEALTGSTLLFIGYSLSDWNFRVLIQSMKYRMQGFMSVAVLVPPGSSNTLQEHAQKYLDKYYRSSAMGLDMHVFWGTAREFVTELRSRM